MAFYLDRWEICKNKRTGGERRTLHSQRTQEWKFIYEDDELQALKLWVNWIRDLPDSVKIAGNSSMDTTADFENP